MDDAATALMMGEIRGELTGINREVRDIKDLLKCKDKDCENCRAEIDAKIAATKTDVAKIQEKHGAEQAVQSWIDTTTGKLAACLTAGLAIAGFALSLKGVVW